MATIHPAAKEEANEEFFGRFIDHQPNAPDPGDAKIAGHGYPVWILIDALAATGGDVGRVAGEYELPDDAVRAAVQFYRRHQAAIDARIRANAAAFGALA